MSGEGKRPHYGLLDTVRGVCILSMVAYHGMYDLVDIFGLPSAWYTGLPGYSALTMPITGKATCRRMAAISSTPLARMPTAPPSLAAWAMAAIMPRPWRGSPGRAWQETIIPR